MFKKIIELDSQALEMPFKFIKKYWEVLLGDIAAVVKYFEWHGQLDKSCTSSFISLIPKVKDPLKISEFRPISLIGCIYKIIAKINFITDEESNG